MKSAKQQVQKNKILLLFIGFIALGVTTKAQYNPNSEFGVIGGVSYYLGDLNTQHFSQNSAFAGLVYRKNIDRRFAYKTNLLYLNLKADDEQNPTDTIASDRGLHFKSVVYELSGQVEFNFLPYETGNSLYPWTPYVYAGLSMFYFNPKAESENGEWLELQPLGTEGQGTTLFPSREKYALTQFAAAMGGGFKIAINKGVNIILEYGIRKTFTDYLDDVSTTYPGGGLVDMTSASEEMSDPNILDPNKENHIIGDQRGNPDKKDWYGFAGLTLSFKLSNKTKGCNY